MGQTILHWLLRARDSNPNYLVQSEACCRYTSPQRRTNIAPYGTIESSSESTSASASVCAETSVPASISARAGTRSSDRPTASVPFTAPPCKYQALNSPD
jgi:hypothetical protein